MHFMPTSKTSRQVAAFLAFALLLGGCATQPKFAPFKPIPQGSQVAVTFNTPEIQIPNAKDGSESVGSNMAKGAGSGAGSGALAGLEASVQCGPFIGFCVPVFSIVGAAGGLVVGSVFGGISGAMLALPTDKAEVLESDLQTFLLETDLQKEMQENFTENIDNRWQVKESQTYPSVVIGFEALNLNQNVQDRLSIEVIHSVVVAYGAGKRDTTKTIRYRYTSDEKHIDYWVEGRGEHLYTEIRTGISENMRGIASKLVQ